MWWVQYHARRTAPPLPLGRLHPWELGLERSPVNPDASFDPCALPPSFPPSFPIMLARGPAVSPATFPSGSGMLQPYKTLPHSFPFLPPLIGIRPLARSLPSPFLFLIHPNPQAVASGYRCWWATAIDSRYPTCPGLFRHCPQASTGSLFVSTPFHSTDVPYLRYSPCTVIPYSSNVLRAQGFLELLRSVHSSTAT